MKKEFLKALCLVGALVFAQPVVGYCDRADCGQENLALENEMKNNSFFWAVKGGDLEEVRKLVKDGVNVNACDEYGNPLLSIVIMPQLISDADGNMKFGPISNKFQIAKLLIENGADVNAKEANGITPLILSIRGDSVEDTEIAKLLIESGASINLRDDYGETPLISAIFYKNAEIAKLLIENGADINACDCRGNHTLALAVLYDQMETVKLLIEKGADVNVYCDEVAAYIRTDESSKSSVLMWAIRNDKTELAKLLIENGTDVNVQNEFGVDEGGYGTSESPSDVVCTRPLHLACMRGNNEIAKLLIENGADVNACDKNDRKPIGFAIWYNHVETVRLLLENKVDVGTDLYNRNTPLHIAAILGDYKLAKLLIENGANIHVCNDFGQEPLYVACEYAKGECYAACDEYIEIVKLLLDQEDDYSYCGLDPLVCACRNNDERVVNVLLERGFYVNVVDVTGDTPLICAARNGNVEIIKTILDKWREKVGDVSGIINDTDCYGLTSLDYAVASGNMEAVQLLLDNGGKIDQLGRM